MTKQLPSSHWRPPCLEGDLRSLASALLREQQYLSPRGFFFEATTGIEPV